MIEVSRRTFLKAGRQAVCAGAGRCGPGGGGGEESVHSRSLPITAGRRCYYADWAKCEWSALDCASCHARQAVADAVRLYPTGMYVRCELCPHAASRPTGSGQVPGARNRDASCIPLCMAIHAPCTSIRLRRSRSFTFCRAQTPFRWPRPGARCAASTARTNTISQYPRRRRRTQSLAPAQWLPPRPTGARQLPTPTRNRRLLRVYARHGSPGRRAGLRSRISSGYVNRTAEGAVPASMRSRST